MQCSHCLFLTYCTVPVPAVPAAVCQLVTNCVSTVSVDLFKLQLYASTTATLSLFVFAFHWSYPITMSSTQAQAQGLCNTWLLTSLCLMSVLTCLCYTSYTYTYT